MSFVCSNTLFIDFSSIIVGQQGRNSFQLNHNSHSRLFGWVRSSDTFCRQRPPHEPLETAISYIPIVSSSAM